MQRWDFFSQNWNFKFLILIFICYKIVLNLFLDVDYCMAHTHTHTKFPLQCKMIAIFRGFTERVIFHLGIWVVCTRGCAECDKSRLQKHLAKASQMNRITKMVIECWQSFFFIQIWRIENYLNVQPKCHIILFVSMTGLTTGVRINPLNFNPILYNKNGSKKKLGRYQLYCFTKLRICQNAKERF